MSKFDLAEKILEYIGLLIFVFGLIITFIIWTPIVFVFYILSQSTFYIHGLEKKRQKNEDDAFNEELDKLIEGLQIEAEKEKPCPPISMERP